ncbi:hypothetical protein ACQVP2_08405 [Methylobacterium aquaticum]|uniref:hypothetical protein n=1 Tax=Methylobacterium aquaticum TaxID=270351 RepID=UPI003D1799A3
MPLGRWVACLFLVAAALPGPAQARQICGKEVVAFDEMVVRIKADPGTEAAWISPAMMQIVDTKRLLIWTLAKPTGSQPAAYICRRIVQEGGAVTSIMTAECHGTQLGCDGIMSRILAEQSRATAPFRQR